MLDLIYLKLKPSSTQNNFFQSLDSLCKELSRLQSLHDHLRLTEFRRLIAMKIPLYRLICAHLNSSQHSILSQFDCREYPTFFSFRICKLLFAHLLLSLRLFLTLIVKISFSFLLLLQILLITNHCLLLIHLLTHILFQYLNSLFDQTFLH